MVSRENSFLEASSRSRLDNYFRQNSRQTSKLRSLQMPLGRWHIKTLLLATGCLLLVINYFHSMRMETGARRQWRRFVINPAKPYKSLPYSRRRHAKSLKDGSNSSDVQLRKVQVPSTPNNKTKPGTGRLKKGTSLAIGQLPKAKIPDVNNTSLQTHKKQSRISNKTLETAPKLLTEKQTKSPQVLKPLRRQNTTSDNNSTSSEDGKQNMGIDKVDGSSLVLKLPIKKPITRDRNIETSVLGLKELLASGLDSSIKDLEAPVKTHEDITLETNDKQTPRPLVADMQRQSLTNVVGLRKYKAARLKAHVENIGLQVPESLPGNMQPESVKNKNPSLNTTSESNNVKGEVQAPLLSTLYNNQYVPENRALKVKPQEKDGQSPQLQGHNTQLQSVKSAILRDAILNMKSDVKPDVQMRQPAADNKPTQSLENDVPEAKSLDEQFPPVPSD